MQPKTILLGTKDSEAWPPLNVFWKIKKQEFFFDFCEISPIISKHFYCENATGGHIVDSGIIS